ncbi:hypothetical protein LCGC14_2476570, partial [marine sediment metagenome]
VVVLSGRDSGVFGKLLEPMQFVSILKARSEGDE